MFRYAKIVYVADSSCSMGGATCRALVCQLPPMTVAKSAHVHNEQQVLVNLPGHSCMSFSLLAVDAADLAQGKLCSIASSQPQGSASTTSMLQPHSDMHMA